MSRSSGPHRATVAFSDTALGQLEKLTARQAVLLDRVLMTLSTDPTLGELRAASSERMQLREYSEGGVRVIYYATVLGTVIVVALVEVD